MKLLADNYLKMSQKESSFALAMVHLLDLLKDRKMHRDIPILSKDVYKSLQKVQYDLHAASAA